MLNEKVSTMTMIISDIQKYLKGAMVIFVDDHSTDKETLDGFSLLTTGEHVCVIQNEGHGQEGALYTGIQHATTQYIACVDCDGQDPIQVLENMYRTILKKHVYAVAGIRITRDDPTFRIMGAKLYHILFQRLLGRKVPAISNFFIVHESVKKSIDPDFVRGAVYRVLTAIYIPYKRRARPNGKSRFTFWKLWKVAKAGLRFAKTGDRYVYEEVS